MDRAGDCRTVGRAVGWLEPLSATEAAHLDNCLDCNALKSGFAKLDELLQTEPAPAAPGGLARSIQHEVARRLAAEALRVRRQTALLMAAASVVILLGSWLGLPALERLEVGAGVWTAEAEGSIAVWQAVTGWLGAQRAALGDVAAHVAAAAPNPSVLLAVVLVPLLIALNVSIGRSARPKGVLVA